MARLGTSCTSCSKVSSICQRSHKLTSFATLKIVGRAFLSDLRSLVHLTVFVWVQPLVHWEENWSFNSIGIKVFCTMYIISLAMVVSSKSQFGKSEKSGKKNSSEREGSADVLSGRHFVRTALDVLSGRHFVRTGLDVLSGRHFVRTVLCDISFRLRRCVRTALWVVRCDYEWLWVVMG